MVSTYSSLVGVAIGGKYEIRRVIGAGGMGVVCEATHVDIGKRVALKLIDKSMKESELIVERFKREARAAGRIDSDNIVDVFDVGADKRVGLYMVMEYLTGEDLQSRLERETKIDTKLGVMIMHQTARALARAHAAGVIHRDLKPANVFLTTRDNGELLVKLLDFGVSKLIGEASGSARITGTGTPIGTPLYMAPEQAEGKDDVDGRADIWSLGAMMYESLSGLLPFADRGTYQSTLVGILTSRPQLLHDAAPWVPRPLASVIDAMLVHDREARIPDAHTVSQRLVEAFPQVLPDGTGKHTAVIVSHPSSSIDATGDTEVFSASTMPSVRFTPPPRQRESAETLSDSDSLDVTGASTALDVPASGRVTPLAPAGGKRTEPLPPSMRVLPPAKPSSPAPVAGGSSPPPYMPLSAMLYGPPSASSGVSLPSTPPVLEPLRPSVAPPGPPRRRPFATLGVVVVIALVGAGAFFAGRRASVAPPPVAATQPPPVAATQPPAPLVIPLAPSHEPARAPTVSVVPVPLVSTVAPSAASVTSAAAASPPLRRRRKAPPAGTVKPASTEEPATTRDLPPGPLTPQMPGPFEQ